MLSHANEQSGPITALTGPSSSIKLMAANESAASHSTSRHMYSICLPPRSSGRRFTSSTARAIAPTDARPSGHEPEDGTRTANRMLEADVAAICNPQWNHTYIIHTRAHHCTHTHTRARARTHARTRARTHARTPTPECRRREGKHSRPSCGPDDVLTGPSHLHSGYTSCAESQGFCRWPERHARPHYSPGRPRSSLQVQEGSLKARCWPFV